MKHKDVVSALVGGAFFAIPYLGLSIAFGPSFVIAISALGASELILTDAKVNDSIDEEKSLNKRLDIARKQNKELKKVIPNIEHNDTKQALGDITVSVDKIIETVHKYPKKVKSVRNFFDYYLPVIVNISLRYDEIENQRLVSKEGKEFIKSADKMIIEASTAFQNILSTLYQKDIVDADAEMKVFNSMLKTDGIIDNDISKMSNGGNK